MSANYDHEYDPKDREHTLSEHKELNHTDHPHRNTLVNSYTQKENGADEHILAVRFEREGDSRSFRRFVEKRDVDHNQKSSTEINQYKSSAPSNQYQGHSSSHDPHFRNNTDYSGKLLHLRTFA